MSKPDEKGFGRSDWILSRPLYRFARFEFKSVTRLQREQALRMQIGQWTPYAETGLYVVWKQDNAHVWAWDAQRVEKGILSSKLQLKGTSIVPETLLHRRQSQGAYLVACLEGYEGQVWRDDSINSSRWWPEPPATNEWINFQRDAGLAPERQSNEVSCGALSLGEAAWARSAVLNGSAFMATRPTMVVPAIPCACLASMVWRAMDQTASGDP